MAITYFPRLQDAYAIERIEVMIQQSPLRLMKFAQTYHQMATFYATAAEPVGIRLLEDLRRSLIELAKSQGFPEKPSKQQARTFDQEASHILDSTMEMVPAEAANREIWNFLSCVLLPDLSKWRFSNPKSDLTYDRWLGGDRNVFRKLWWREVTLGRELNSKLGEDEAVGIMERPLLSGNAQLARASAKALLTVAEQHKNIARSELMRKGMVGVRRMAPIINFEVFTEEELDDVVLDIFQKTSQAFAKHLKEG